MTELSSDNIASNATRQPDKAAGDASLRWADVQTTVPAGFEATLAQPVPVVANLGQPARFDASAAQSVSVDAALAQPTRFDASASQPARFDAVVAQPTRVQDRPAQPGNSVLTVNYGDPALDQSLAAGGFETLQINGLPQDVRVNNWMNDRGTYFWFQNGSDGKQPHYFPQGFKTLIVDGHRKNADELRLEAVDSYLKEAEARAYPGDTIKPLGFSAVEADNPLGWDKRMGNIGEAPLHALQINLAKDMQTSPNDPYMRLYMAELLAWKAAPQMIDAIKEASATGKNIELKDPGTLKQIDQAIVEAQNAQEISRRIGNIGAPNLGVKRPLAPFALDPSSYNPDAYWFGAMNQANRLEEALQTLRNTATAPPDRLVLP